MDTRRGLIEQALTQLEQRGLNRFSLRAVGEAAGLSPMAVYRHFKNKEDLLRAVGEEAFDSFYKFVAAIPEGSIDVWLRKLTRVYVDFALDSPGRFDACFVVRTQVERRYPQDFRAGKSPVISMTMHRLQAAQAAGFIECEDATELALLIWSQTHGLVMLYRAGRFSIGRAAFVALCERASQRFIDGAAAHPSAASKPHTKKRSLKVGRQ
jgi:AcrR family transcriptional regulator